MGGFEVFPCLLHGALPLRLCLQVYFKTTTDFRQVPQVFLGQCLFVFLVSDSSVVNTSFTALEGVLTPGNMAQAMSDILRISGLGLPGVQTYLHTSGPGRPCLTRCGTERIWDRNVQCLPIVWRSDPKPELLKLNASTG